MMKKGIKGFSLAELSIVLIIIGLLVGGVMQGGKMVHQAKLRSLANIFQGHNQAVYTFKLSYDALPGDMSNASLYFQGATDGNGDGQILETTSQIISHLKLSSIDILQQSNTGFIDIGFRNIEFFISYNPHPLAAYGYNGEIGNYGSFYNANQKEFTAREDANPISGKIRGGMALGSSATLTNCFKHDSGTLTATNFHTLNAKYDNTKSSQDCAILLNINAYN
jgi:prepilin-type N-terminal cleavage/methylation domain-containing protein